MRQRARIAGAVARQPLLAGQAIHSCGATDEPVDDGQHGRSLLRPAQDGLDDRHCGIGSGKIALDLSPVFQGIPQQVLFDMTPDRRDIGFSLVKFELSRFAGQKGRQFSIVLQAVIDHVIGQSQFASLLAGIMPHGDISLSGDRVVAFIDQRLSIEIKGRIDIADPVQQHRSLVTVGAIAGEHIGGRQIAHAGHDQLFPLSIDQIGADETPSLTVLHIALSVIHAETMQRIMEIRMFDVEQQSLIRFLRIEQAVAVQAAAIIRGKIIFRKKFVTMGTLYFPGIGMRVDLPVVHRDRLFTRRAKTVGPHHPGAGDGGCKHQIPQGLIGHGHPRRCAMDRLIADLLSPWVRGGAGLYRGSDILRIKNRSLFGADR
ncbi:MAG: hypothetical protein BWY83_02333 [bacterium ADurb.Bin478]|nr:MAG: hypothetical protein BWY83_02333 [bacterium ADurb.Bin478]